MRTHCTVFTLLLLACSVSEGQSKSLSAKAASIETLLNSRFAQTKCPGLSVAVAKRNQIIVSKALGLADIEQHVPMTQDSVNRLGSLSKPITGTIIMDLVEHGKLVLDSSIRSYLPELPDFYESVTLRELLDHQSGVRGYTTVADVSDIAFNTVHYATSREVLKTFVSYPLMFTPGSKVEYGSLSFTLLAAAAEAVTGKSFQQVADAFFANHKIRGFYLDDSIAIVPKRVRGYLVDSDANSKITFNAGQTMTRDWLVGESGEVTNARFYDISNRYPAGGFDASPEDVLQFTIAVASGGVLSPDTVRQMWTAQKTADGAQTVFGLGWGVSQFSGAPMVGMNGAEPATTAFLRYLPESGVGVAMVCNAEAAKGLSDLLNDLLKIANE